MSRPLALVVTAFDAAPFSKALIDAVVVGLDARYEVAVLDLPALGFAAAMTAQERRAYHTAEPIVDPMVREHTELVTAASALVLVFPTRWWEPAAVLKGWLDRVLLPGVAFVFDEDHRVRPHMRLDVIAGITTYDMGVWDVHRVGDGSRRMLLRTVRANAPLRAKTAWIGLYREPAASPRRRSRFLERVERRMRRL